MDLTSRVRRATAADATALRDLERAAGLRALGHIFPPEMYPYPDAEVLERWRQTLGDPSVTVLVTEDEHGLTSLIAFDEVLVRHLAVRPDCWRQGLARQAMAAAHSSGHAPSRLWCLDDNDAALAFYRELGWVRTGRVQQAPFPPYPQEVELALEASRQRS